MPFASYILFTPLSIRCQTSQVALAVKSPLASVGDAGSIPGLGRYPEVGDDNPPQYSCLENSMDRGAWRAAVHRASKSQT